MNSRLLKGKMAGILVVFLALFMVAGIAEGERMDASGQWMYVLQDGGATITWITADDPAGDLSIPGELDGYAVTGIGEYAFAECEKLTSVIIPEGVTSIGDSAFIHCLGLVSVTIPDSVASIGIGAFYRCAGLTDVTIPDKVKYIGQGAFQACGSLTSVTIPPGVRSIGEDAFYGCGDIALVVAQGSFAEQYALNNRIPYAYIAESDNAAVEEITVETAEELLAALGSNRRVLLQEGVYNLTAAAAGFQGSSNVFFRERSDGPELVLNEIHNLTIQGVGASRSEIVIAPRCAYVMVFTNCLNIRIATIKAGHEMGDECEGGVFSFDSSTGIRVDDTAMYGCGAVGIDLNESTDAQVAGSTIYECTSGITSIFGCSDILFTDCVFRDNTGDVHAVTTSNLTIDSCSFLRNADEFAMFYIMDSENITVKNTEFVDNDAEDLAFQSDSDVKFDASNRFENNTFDVTR